LVFLRSVRRLLVTVDVVPSTPSLVTMMKEALSSSETSLLTSQKTQFFIVTAVKTSNLTLMYEVRYRVYMNTNSRIGFSRTVKSLVKQRSPVNET
jgi:hypothetical protein